MVEVSLFVGVKLRDEDVPLLLENPQWYHALPKNPHPLGASVMRIGFDFEAGTPYLAALVDYTEGDGGISVCMMSLEDVTTGVEQLKAALKQFPKSLPYTESHIKLMRVVIHHQETVEAEC